MSTTERDARAIATDTHTFARSAGLSLDEAEALIRHALSRVDYEGNPERVMRYLRRVRRTPLRFHRGGGRRLMGVDNLR